VKSPLATTLVNVRVEVPVFVSVTVFDELVVLICWRLNVRLVGDKLTVVVPALAPVPVRPTTCGLPAALSVIVIVPVCVPVAVGVKVTLIEQFAPAASDAPQVVVSAYWALGTMLVMLRDAVPELVSVTDCAALVVFNAWPAKVRLVGDNDTAGAFGAAPVPVRLTVWGLPAALSVMVMVPVCVPLAVGVNLTLIEQFAPAASDAPQVVVSEYCALATILLIERDALPELVSVMDWAALVVFRA
jgi:hypothetical protein